MKFLDENGVQYLWKQVSLEDYPNNETLIATSTALTNLTEIEIGFQEGKTRSNATYNYIKVINA